MQAYKIKGKLTPPGHLTLTEPINLPVGDVEVIILQEIETTPQTENPQAQQPENPKNRFQTNIFTEWLAKAKPVSPDYDLDQARLEALQEKHLQ